ncbi:hypothetical protein GN956_G5109 [Arapaima gigas]
MASAGTRSTFCGNEGDSVAREKISEDFLRRVLAQWGPAPRVTGLQDKLSAALELCHRFPLDVAVTRGTMETNVRLAKVLCGPQSLSWEDRKEDLRKQHQFKCEDQQVGAVKEEMTQESSETVEGSEETRTRAAGNRTGDTENVCGRGRRGEGEEGQSGTEGSVKADGDDGDSSATFLHSRAPNVRFRVLQNVSVLSSGSPSQAGSVHQVASDLDLYDALVFLTSEQNQEEHLALATELSARNKLLLLVRAELGWDLLQKKSTGACKTCAWERMQKLRVELKQRKTAAELNDQGSTDFCLDDSGFRTKLLGLEEVQRHLTATLPKLKSKAFHKFVMDVSKELRVPKLFRSNKIELTDQPAKLLSILDAQENFQMDIGILGEPACGSSSLVNSLRELSNQDEGAAATGSPLPPKLAVAYPYPALPNARLWDLPGISLSSYPPEREPRAPFPPYPHPPCDIYILMLPHSLGPGSQQFLQRVSSLGRPCLAVLGRADELNEATVTELRDGSLEALRQAGLGQHLFLVSSLRPDRWDFPQLKQVLHDSVASHRRESFARFMVERLEEEWSKHADSCCIL